VQIDAGSLVGILIDPITHAQSVQSVAEVREIIVTHGNFGLARRPVTQPHPQQIGVDRQISLGSLERISDRDSETISVTPGGGGNLPCGHYPISPTIISVMHRPEMILVGYD